MTRAIDDLKARAKAGDLEALQELRDSGYFRAVKASREGYAASHGQRRLWVLRQIEGGTTAYHIPLAVALEGALDRAALGAALCAVVARHEVLRTTFRSIDDELRQLVHDDVGFRVHEDDLSAAPDAEARCLALLSEDATTDFDLEAGPLIRARLIRLADERHVLGLCIHHIVCDVWSLGVLVREVSALYGAFAAGRPDPLSALAIQYKDYAAWQNGLLAGPEAAADRDYWHAKLQDPPPPLRLPVDRPRPNYRTVRGGTVSAELEAPLLRGLQALARAEQTTLFTALTAAVKLLLYRYSGARDLVVAAPIAGRDRPELENQFGYYGNTLLLRDRIEGAWTFRRLLAAVKQTAIEAFAHQHYPFDQLVTELDLPRDLGRFPLADVSINLMNTEPACFELGELRVSNFETGFSVAKVELSFDFAEVGERLQVGLNYNADLYDDATARRLVDHLVHLVKSLLRAPECALDRLDLLPEAEREQLLGEFGRGRDLPLTDQTIAARFEAQAARTPERPALADGGRELSYRELNSEANRLARHLRRQGVGPEVIVAVLMSRGADQVIAVLAILKAGGAYLPLDPGNPVERTAAILGDSLAPVVLSQEELEDRLPSLLIEPILVDQDRDAWRGDPDGDLEGGAEAAGLAYVIYTSGTTGAPRGVPIAHRSFVNMIDDQIRGFGVSERDRVLQFANSTFDASLSEIFMALLSGACLVVARPEVIAEPPAFLRLLEDQAVTVATLPPSYLHGLERAPLAGLRTLITAGEAAIAEDARHYARSLTYFNAYGPTEAAVCSAYHRVDAGRDYGLGVPIGRPIANGELLILDQHLQPLPVGIAGEICLAGVGLARGYLNRPERTAASFVAHPFRAGERLYRTGDRGCRLADGSVLFQGRLDHQIKLRGYRIEPGEVEGALCSHPAVDLACVTARAQPDQPPSLVAYYCRQRRVEPWPSVAEFFVYDELLYSAMSTHAERNRLYLEAFAEALPGKTVVEIGTGPEAILAQLCIKAGARKVYAVEKLRDSFERACDRVRALGLEDRIVVLHGDATAVQLPETVDYCISEIVGSIGGSEGAAVLSNDARRFLAAPENMIPRRSLTKIAAMSLPDDFGFAFPPSAAGYVERIFAEVGRRFDLRLCLKNVSRRQLISSEDAFEDLDYTGPIDPSGRHRISLEFVREGLFHGFLVWLELELAPERWLNILDSPHSWLPVYLPVSLEGHAVEPGDRFEAEISRQLSDNGINPDYLIEGSLERSGATAVSVRCEAPHRAAGFRATPFYERLFADGSVPASAAASPEELKDHLRAKLPGYLCPDLLVELDGLPLSANGKIDRAALPDPWAARRGPAESLRAPASALERRLAGIFEEVLGVPSVGADQSFFDLGGHSLLATQVISRIRRQFDLELPMPRFFEANSVAALAAALGEIETSPGRSAKVAEAMERMARMSDEEKRAFLERHRTARQSA